MSEAAHHPSNPKPHAESEYEHEGRLKIVIAGLDKNVRDQAVEAANAALNEKIAGDGGGSFKDFLKHAATFKLGETRKDLRAMGRRIRYGNLGRDYYLNKYRAQAEQEIIETGNLLTHDDVIDEDYKVHTTMRFAKEYDEMIHRDAGERRTKLDFETRPDGSRDEEGHRLKTELHQLIKDAASGTFDDANGNFDENAFNEEKKRVITGAVQAGLTKDHVGPSMMYADNLLQIATHVRAAAERRRLHGEDDDVDAMLDNTDIVLGEAKTGARTEIVESRVEKTVRKLASIPWVNEGTVATGVSILYSLGGWATKYGIGKAVAAVALPGLAGGVWAGLREKMRIEEERVQHSREMAEGKLDRNDLTGRRVELDKTIYETKSAIDLKDQIGILYDEDGELRINSPERFTEAMLMIAEAQARIRLSDQKKIDLISFSEVGKVEKERFELDLALAKGKADMRKMLKNASDDELRAMGLGDETIRHMRDPHNDELDFLMEPQIEGVQGVLDATIARLEKGSEERGEEGIEARDRLFKKLRRKEVAKAVVKGTLIGAAVGLFVQELYTAPAYGVGTGTPVATAIIDDGRATLETPVHAMGNGKGAVVPITPEDPTTITSSNGNVLTPTESVLVAPDTKFNLPTGFEVKPDAATNEATITGHGMAVEHLKLTPDGALTDESIASLKAAGFRIDAIEPTHTSQEIVTEMKGQTAHDVLAHHQDEAVQVKRDYWYDNDTTNIFEKNEQGLWNPYKEADGSIRVTIGGMTDNGSYHDGVHAHWRELAAKGELQVAFSLSKSTQSEVFMFNIDENGNAIIPSDHFLASMFSKQGDSWRFDGKYTEVVQVHDTDARGITHISPLATDIGKGKSEFTDHVLTKQFTKSTTYTISYVETEEPREILIPPTVPIYGRGGLQPVRRIPNVPGDPQDPYGAPYGYEAAQDMADKWALNRSPRLRDNPEAKLNVVDELKWYFERHSAPYRRELARRTQSNEALRNMNENTELMINIPVAAAHEVGNIFRTLSLYASQDAESLAQTQFVLSLNWKEGSDRTAISATIAEVERARQAFPQMNISFFLEEWPEEFVKERGGAIYGTVIKSLYDTSLWAIADANSRTGGNIDPLVVTNDADAKAISRNYLRQLIRSRERSPEADILMGKIHWGSETFKDYPGYGVVSSFFMLLEDRVRDTHNTIAPASWGPNSAFKASSMAAVGGVNGDMGAGADSELGKRIIAARRPASAIQVTGTDTYGGVPLSIAGGVVAETARGAWVDSSPERLLTIYKNGQMPLTSAWNNFDSGGYTPRPDLKVGEAEDVSRDFDTIKQRIEFQFSGILSSNWSIVQDNDVVNAALENIFFTPSGSNLWTITGDRYSRKFTFTAAGEQELKAVLNTIHTSVQEGLEMIDDIHEKAASQTTPPVAQPSTPVTPVAADHPPSPERQAQLNTLRRIEAGPGLSVVEADLIVDGYPFKGEMVFERIDPDEGDYVFMPLNNRSGDTWFALGSDELLRAIASGRISLKK